MIVSEINFRHIVRILLREVEEKSSIDSQKVKLDQGDGGALSAIEAPDPKNPKQKIALLVQDNKIKVMFKPEGEEPKDIPVSSDEWHHALGALVAHIEDHGSKAAKDELKAYVKSLYPDLDNDLPALLRRYRMLGIE